MKRHTIRTCKGKVVFFGVLRVRPELTVRIALRYRDHAEAVIARDYECPACNGWHITSRKTWVER